MNLLNLESEKFKNVEVRGYNFKIKFISPQERMQIANQRIAFQNGQPVEALTQGEYDLFMSIATVNACVEEYPTEFNENESCARWDDEDLIVELAQEIQKHTDDIKSKLKKNKPISGGE